MDYDLNEQQHMIQEAAHKFLSKECPSEFVRKMAEDERGFTDELWKGMTDLGWMSLLVPEEYGGFGGDFLDLAVLLSEMGYFALPGPYFSTVVLGGLTLLEAGNEEQKRETLAELSQGKRFLTLAWVEKEGTFSPDGIQTKADAAGNGYVLSGTKLFVPDAHVADPIICAARTGKDPEQITLFLVDPKTQGVTISPLETMAGDKQFEVVLENAEIPADGVLGEVDGAWPVLRKVQMLAAVAKCAEMAGGARKAMDLVLPWTKERIQFGRPIGSFQAVQHHCANMLTYLDTLTLMTYKAAWRISAGRPYEAQAFMCKAWVSDSYRKLVALAHQVLGGLGFMEEHDLGLYFKRAKEAEIFFGDADFHREETARRMGL